MCYIPWYIACYITCFLQAGLLDPPDAEELNMFTASERLIQEHVRKYKNGAAELKDLIQQVLHHLDPRLVVTRLIWTAIALEAGIRR